MFDKDSSVAIPRVLIIFNAGATAYGMERTVIELFDLLRPEVEPRFLMSYTTRRLDLPILREIEGRGLCRVFLSDWTDWPRIGKPKSVSNAWRMLLAIVRGNRDVQKASRDIDVIYVPGINYCYLAALAAFRHRLRGRRVVYHFHNLITKPSIRLRLINLLVTDYVHNTAIGRQRIFTANPFIKKKQNWVIPLTLYGDRPRLKDDEQVVMNGGPNILYVGQVSRHKGVHILLDAFEEVAKANNRVWLHILGACDDLSLTERILGASGNTRIRWWGYRNDINDFLRQSDLLVQPSPVTTNESFGRSVLEAMAAGIPCVCFGSGALKELVISGETGLTCDDESIACLANSIAFLLDDDVLRARWGAKAKEVYQARYSAPRIRGLWLECLGTR